MLWRSHHHKIILSCKLSVENLDVPLSESLCHRIKTTRIILTRQQFFQPLQQAINHFSKLPSDRIMSTFISICALIIGGYYVWANHANGKKDSETLTRLTSLEAQLKKREDDLQQQETSLRKRLQEVEERDASLKRQIDEIENRIQIIEQREKALAEAEAALAVAEAEKEHDPEAASEEAENDTASSDNKPSEGEKRKKMIEEELTRLVKKAEETELEEPFDEDSLEALRKAALKICYLKKFYDVMKDELIFFPSVTTTLVNYSLLEEAEKFYFEEDDEYPQDLAIGLRSVATQALVDADDDTDEEYMAKLALDVEI